jgi:hypothetical protein
MSQIFSTNTDINIKYCLIKLVGNRSRLQVAEHISIMSCCISVSEEGVYVDIVDS